jgi:NAD(P)H-dependent FMN reductase
MSDINVLALVGSLRAASVNHQIAALAAETAPAGITVNLYQGLGGASANSRSTARTSTTPPTYPPRLARCATPSPTPTRSWW